MKNQEMKANDPGGSDLRARVGERLRELREARGVSLNALATLAGLEPSLLVRIEAGDCTPSLGVLWKIAVGLGVPFAELLGGGERAISVRRGAASQVLRSADGQIESRPLIASGTCRSVEAYALTLAGGGRHESEPHPRGTREIVVVLSGLLSVRIGDRVYELEPGDSIFFPADLQHTYQNPGTQPGRYHNIIVYDE